MVGPRAGGKRGVCALLTLFWSRRSWSGLTCTWAEWPYSELEERGGQGSPCVRKAMVEGHGGLPNPGVLQCLPELQSKFLVSSLPHHATAGWVSFWYSKLSLNITYIWETVFNVIILILTILLSSWIFSFLKWHHHYHSQLPQNLSLERIPSVP